MCCIKSLFGSLGNATDAQSPTQLQHADGVGPRSKHTNKYTDLNKGINVFPLTHHA